MDAHQGQVHAGLDPAEHALDVLLISILVARTEKTAGIEGPPGLTCRLHSQSRDDLAAQGLEVIAYVAAPGGGSIALDAGEGAAGQDHRATAGVVGAQTFVHGLVDHQRIAVADELAGQLAAHDAATQQVVVLWLCGILPPGINVIRTQQVGTEILPVEGGCGRIEEIDPVRAGDVVLMGIDLLAEFGVAVDLGPHGKHQAQAVGVQLARERGGVGVVVFVEAHGVPAVLAPPLPVLHQHIHGNLLRTEALGGLQNLVGRVETFAAMDVAHGPAGHEGSVARDVAEG